KVCDLSLLLGECRLLLRQSQRMLTLELSVVTGIRSQLAPVEMDDRSHDRVEKIAVVGDEQQRSGIPLQPLLEPEHGVEIEMVGRLIEQQQIRARHQRLSQV